MLIIRKRNKRVQIKKFGLSGFESISKKEGMEIPYFIFVSRRVIFNIYATLTSPILKHFQYKTPFH